MSGVYALVEVDGEVGIWHLECGVTSWNPMDVERRYCSACHEELDVEIPGQ